MLSSAATVDVLMAGVFDHQSDVVFASKSNSSNHIVGLCDIDGVAGVVAQLAWLGCWSERDACIVLKVGVHDLGWVVETTADAMSTMSRMARPGLRARRNLTRLSL